MNIPNIRNILFFCIYSFFTNNLMYYNKPIFVPTNPLLIKKNFSNNIKILDTSKGDVIDYNIINQEIHRLKCKNCGFLYEGINLIKQCPICSSKNFDDTYDDVIL